MIPAAVSLLSHTWSIEEKILTYVIERSVDNTDAIRPRRHLSLSLPILTLSTLLCEKNQDSAFGIGDECGNVFYGEHAQQLGVCVQHQRACAHHITQLRERDDHGGRVFEGEAVFRFAGRVGAGTDGGGYRVCLGGCAVKGNIYHLLHTPKVR
jgi:hypothetical protein